MSDNMLHDYTSPVKKAEREIVGRETEMRRVKAALMRPELCNVMLLVRPILLIRKLLFMIGGISFGLMSFLPAIMCMTNMENPFGFLVSFRKVFCTRMRLRWKMAEL